MSGGKKRIPLAAGNWKCHMTVEQSVALARAVQQGLSLSPGCEVVLSPVFTALCAVREELKAGPIRLAAQDVYWEEQGAFTGEVSAPQLRDAGCSYVIVGHSERRQLFGETDKAVKRKARAVLAHGMAPIICVGETLAEREAGKTLERIVSQVRAALDEMSAEQLARVVIAYEPVWAIGTGVTASAGDAQQAQSTIREEIGGRFGAELSGSMRILYGGSVKPDNAASLMAQPDVDGALVGGASLSADSFIAIVEAATG